MHVTALVIQATLQVLQKTTAIHVIPLITQESIRPSLMTALSVIVQTPGMVLLLMLHFQGLMHH